METNRSPAYVISKILEEVFGEELYQKDQSTIEACDKYLSEMVPLQANTQKTFDARNRLG